MEIGELLQHGVFVGVLDSGLKKVYFLWAFIQLYSILRLMRGLGAL